MPFVRRDLFLRVSTSLSETGDEARAALVVGVLLGIVERDDPENAILTLARSAHFAATSRVMHDHDGNLSSPQVEEPWINEFPTVGFIFLHPTLSVERLSRIITFTPVLMQWAVIARCTSASTMFNTLPVRSNKIS